MSGQRAPPVVFVGRRFVSSGPSTPISYKLNGSEAAAPAAITARPSGRHVGVTYRVPGADAITRTARVSALTSTTSEYAPARCRSTAIERPSGDQRGALNWV